MKPVKRVLLLGGGGFIGSAVAAALAARGIGTTVQTRRIVRASHLSPLPTVGFVQADPYDDAALNRLMPGHNAVVNLIATLHAPFEAAHVDLPARAARVAAASGVTHFLHFSALGAGLTAPSGYLQSKERGESALHNVSDGSGMTATVLRPSVVFGEHDNFLNLFGTLAKWSPFIPLGSPSALFQPVWVEDVARAVVECLENPTAQGGTWNLVGPRIYTLRELIGLVMRLSGHRRPILTLGPSLSMMQAAVFEHLPGRLITRDNVLSMRVPNTSDAPFPFFAAHELETTAARWLGAAKFADPFASARERAGR
ncbi:MAG: NAD-dependent epimerase/dehydratase family protein [Betaproteobacteria bacterium]|nr:NAD-dependent epimerase/dehydratase family protein [Betaproteobacteria bacterium]